MLLLQRSLMGGRYGRGPGLASCRCLASPSKDPYAVLGIPRGSSAKAARDAYLKLSKQHHPDRSSAPDAQERFAELSAAYDAIKSGKTQPQTPPPPPPGQRRPPEGFSFGSRGFNRPPDFDEELRKRFWRGEGGFERDGAGRSDADAARRAAEHNARVAAEFRKHFGGPNYAGHRDFESRRQALRKTLLRSYLVSLALFMATFWGVFSYRMREAVEDPSRVTRRRDGPIGPYVAARENVYGEQQQKRLEDALRKDCESKDPSKMSPAEAASCEQFRRRTNILPSQEPKPPPPPFGPPPTVPSPIV